MKGTSYRIVVKDLSKLEKYGFKKVEKDPKYTHSKYEYVYYWYSGSTDRYGKPVYSISVHDDDNKANMSTCGGGALKVLCEMFRDGIIEFIDVGGVEHRIKRKKEQIAKLEREIESLCQTKTMK